MKIRIYLTLLGGMSLLAFFAFGFDKHRAKKGEGRLPEALLLSLATFGGGLGAAAGMALFRHKTAKGTKFHFGVTVFLSCAVQAALALLGLTEGGLLP